MFEELNYSALRLFWDILQSVGVLVVIVWNIMDRRRQTNSDEISGLKTSQDEFDRRIQRIEDAQARSPTHQDLTEVTSQVSALKEKIEAQNNLLQTIHQFLLTNKKGG